MPGCVREGGRVGWEGELLQAYFPGQQSSTSSSNRKEGEKVLYHIIYMAGMAKSVMAS